MRREIKFRGKITANGGPCRNLKDKDGDWIYTDEEPSFFQTEVGVFIGSYNEEVQVDPETFGQYTGLKDKNNRDVYEDDILTDIYGSIGVVEWRQGGFIVNFGDDEFFPISDCFDNSSQKMWIIGNIHDNQDY